MSEINISTITKNTVDKLVNNMKRSNHYLIIRLLYQK